MAAITYANAREGLSELWDTSTEGGYYYVTHKQGELVTGTREGKCTQLIQGMAVLALLFTTRTHSSLGRPSESVGA